MMRYNRPDLQRDYDLLPQHYQMQLECQRYNRPDLQRDYDIETSTSVKRISVIQATTDLIYKGIMTRIVDLNLCCVVKLQQT